MHGFAARVGLLADGSVVVDGNNSNGEGNVTAWKNIVALAGGDDFVVGLKADGTLVACGRNDYGQCNVTKWDLWD